MKIISDAYISLPCLVLLKDIVATVIVLSNEPGISAVNVRHYHFALMPGGLLFGGAGMAWIFNLICAAMVGLLISCLYRNRMRAG
jgi:hypothetical protein